MQTKKSCVKFKKKIKEWSLRVNCNLYKRLGSTYSVIWLITTERFMTQIHS